MKYPALRWIRSTDFVILTAVLVAVCVGGYAFKDFIVYAFSSNMALNSLILGALLVGSFMIYQQSYQLFRERHLVRWWHRAVTENPALHRTRPAFFDNCLVRDLIDRTDRVALNPTAELGADMVEAEAERVAHQLDYNQELCRFMVGLMVALGLLGTFVGLLETLVQVSDLVGSIGAGMTDKGNAEASMTNVILGLKNPMKAMGTAFSASMFGLIGSIVLGLQMVRLANSTSATNRDIRLLSLRTVEVINDGNPRSKDASALLREYVHELSNQGQHISTSLEQMTAISNSALPMLADIGTHMRDSVTQALGLTSSLREAQQYMRPLDQLPVLLRESIDSSHEISQKTADSSQALERVHQSQQHLLEAMAEMNTSLVKVLESADRKAERMIQAIADVLHDNQQGNQLIAARLAGLQELGKLSLDTAGDSRIEAREANVLLRRSLTDIQVGMNAAAADSLQSMAVLTDVVAGGNADAQLRFDESDKQISEIIEQDRRAIEYLALLYASMATIPGMTRDLRTMLAELPRRDDALASFVVAVERFNASVTSSSSRNQAGRDKNVAEPAHDD